LERVKEFHVTNFAYVFANSGVLLIPTAEMLAEIQRNNLPVSLDSEGNVRHYHIQFYERDSAIFWNLRENDKSVTSYFSGLN
jgi:hypothetical protein